MSITVNGLCSCFVFGRCGFKFWLEDWLSWCKL